ncbi:hypothetical protein [Bacillus cereus]
MKLVINFGDHEENEYVNYMKEMDKFEKEELRIVGMKAIMDHIDNQKEQKEREEKQEKCKHKFVESGSSRCDWDGEPYFDEEYDIVERIDFHCTLCGKGKSEMRFDNW